MVMLAWTEGAFREWISYSFNTDLSKIENLSLYYEYKSF